MNNFLKTKKIINSNQKKQKEKIIIKCLYKK